MSELLPLLETLVADARAGRPVALCTVVRTRGSTPQCPGASMLVRSNMQTLGTLGGGCVEAEVRKRAFALLRENRSGLLDFLLNHDYGWDDGLICGGRMYVAVAPLAQKTPEPASRGDESVSPPTPLSLHDCEQALEHARRFEPAWIPIRVETDRGVEEYRLHLEVPPTLLIAGAGHVGQALAKLAAELDFRVVVIDDRADLLTRERFGPRIECVAGDIAATLAGWPIDRSTYVVIVTRGHQHDHAALDAVIRRDAAYIGMIGSRRKGRMILRDLEQAGVSRERIEAVRTPIGLDIGAVTVPEIAVSIAAELVQRRRQRAPKLIEGPLRVGAG